MSLLKMSLPDRHVSSASSWVTMGGCLRMSSPRLVFTGWHVPLRSLIAGSFSTITYDFFARGGCWRQKVAVVFISRPRNHSEQGRIKLPYARKTGYGTKAPTP
jgi:hypothetical protein